MFVDVVQVVRMEIRLRGAAVTLKEQKTVRSGPKSWLTVAKLVRGSLVSLSIPFLVTY